MDSWAWSQLGLVRVPGIGLVYSELARRVPHIFSHFITNLPAIRSIVVFVCVKYLPVHAVPEGERFLVKLIGPMNFRMFRCVVRKLFDSLSTFVRLESMMDGGSDSDDYSIYDQETEQQSEMFF
jgi:KUP system potassium uptake protein